MTPSAPATGGCSLRRLRLDLARASGEGDVGLDVVLSSQGLNLRNNLDSDVLLTALDDNGVVIRTASIDIVLGLDRALNMRIIGVQGQSLVGLSDGALANGYDIHQGQGGQIGLIGVAQRIVGTIEQSRQSLRDTRGDIGASQGNSCDVTINFDGCVNTSG